MTQLHDHPVNLKETAAPEAYQHIDVAKVGGSLGAIVGGIAISGDLAPAAVAELRAALLAHRVVFLRDQQHADDADQLAFAGLLGQVTKPHPTVAGDGKAVLPIDSERGKEERYREEFRHLEFETEHPVVRLHPETGEPSLLLGHFVRSFVGLSSGDFADLFGLLQRHITRLENTVRWTWRDGDIAIWDNRATQHYAVADYDNQRRRLHRITVAGDIPIGIKGDMSVPRKGDASFYSTLPA